MSRAGWSELGYGLSLLLAGVAGAYFLLTYFERLPLQTQIPYLDLAVGILLLLFALHFLWRLLIARRIKARIMTMGTHGPIWISPVAIRDFLLRLLREEFGIRRATVSLRAMGEGIAVEVRASLPSGGSIADLGERIQDRIRSRIEDRVGVDVQRVEVYTRGIDSSAASGVSSQEEAGTETASDEWSGERDRL